MSARAISPPTASSTASVTAARCGTARITAAGPDPDTSRGPRCGSRCSAWRRPTDRARRRRSRSCGTRCRLPAGSAPAGSRRSPRAACGSSHSPPRRGRARRSTGRRPPDDTRCRSACEGPASPSVPHGGRGSRCIRAFPRQSGGGREAVAPPRLRRGTSRTAGWRHRRRGGAFARALRGAEEVGLAIVGVVAVGAQHVRARVPRTAPAEQRLASDPVAGLALRVGRMLDVGGGCRPGVEFARTVTALAIGVGVAGDEVIRKGVVTVEARCGADHGAGGGHGLGVVAPGCLELRRIVRARQKHGERDDGRERAESSRTRREPHLPRAPARRRDPRSARSANQAVTASGPCPDSGTRMFSSSAMKDPPLRTMWCFARLPSWHDEQVEVMREMFRSSSGSVTSSPVSIVDDSVAEASSVL